MAVTLWPRLQFEATINYLVVGIFSRPMYAIQHYQEIPWQIFIIYCVIFFFGPFQWCAILKSKMEELCCFSATFSSGMHFHIKGVYKCEHAEKPAVNLLNVHSDPFEWRDVEILSPSVHDSTLFFLIDIHLQRQRTISSPRSIALYLLLTPSLIITPFQYN